MKESLCVIAAVLLLSINVVASDNQDKLEYESYPEYYLDEESGIENEYDGPETEDFEGAIEEGDSSEGDFLFSNENLEACTENSKCYDDEGGSYWMDSYENMTSEELMGSDLTDEQWEEHRDYHGTN